MGLTGMVPDVAETKYVPRSPRGVHRYPPATYGDVAGKEMRVAGHCDDKVAIQGSTIDNRYN